MEIPFRGQIDVALLRRMNLSLITSKKALLWIVLVVTALLYGTVIVPLTNGGSLRDVAPVLIVMVLFAGMMVYTLFFGGPKKQMASNRLLQGPISGAATEDNLRMETAHSRSELPWDVFFRAKIGKGLVLLYTSSQVVHLFPREFFSSDADWDAFVGLVRQRVPLNHAGRGGARRTLKVFLLWVVVFVVVMLVYSFWGR